MNEYIFKFNLLNTVEEKKVSSGHLRKTCERPHRGDIRECMNPFRRKSTVDIASVKTVTKERIG